MAVGDSELQGYDESQKEMMEESCIVVDNDDLIRKFEYIRQDICSYLFNT